MTHILMDAIEGAWRYTPRPVQVNGVVVDAHVYAEQGDWPQLEAWGIYEEWKSPDPAPLGYAEPVVEMKDGRNKAARYPAGTESERAEAQREQHAAAIINQRDNASYLPIDLTRDPGLQGLMDESVSAAEIKLQELDATPDDDIYIFDPTLNLAGDPNSIQIARSLITQESPFINDPALSTQQQTDLQSIMVAQQAVVDAGDPDASVPEPPSFLRTRIGVVAEDYGQIIARRVEDAGWWWLTFELHTDRELNTNEYWMSVYDSTANNDRDDTTTGYLTVAQLTQDPNDSRKYYADRAAVNLPDSGIGTIYKFTLNWAHLSNPQFDKLTLRGGVTRMRYRVRWAGRSG